MDTLSSGSSCPLYSIVIECMHLTSWQSYWCSKTVKQQPCWCTKPIPWEFNSFLIYTLFFVPINKFAWLLEVWVHVCSLSAVTFCNFISHLIGHETINISEIFMFMVLQERQYVTELVDCTCSNFWAELSWISVNIYSILQPVYQTLYFQYLVLRKYFYMSFPAVCYNTCTLDRSWSKMTSLKSCWSVHHLAICLSYQCVTPW